ARFLAAHPEVEVHLDGTNRRVDVIAEGFDIAIGVRFPPLAPSDLVMRRLDESTQTLVASPALVGTARTTPAYLGALPSLDLGAPRRDDRWTLVNAEGLEASSLLRPRLITDDMTGLRGAALPGVGIVKLPTIMIWVEVRAGRLIQVLPA